MASDDQSIRPIVIGIAGPTRAGKTSLATALKHHFQALEFLTVETYCGSGWCATESEKAEMDKMLQTECFVQVDGKELPNLEDPRVHCWPQMESDLNELIKQTTTMPSLPDRKPRIVIMEGASEPVCKERRLRTSAWVTPAYWDQCIWPGFLKWGQPPQDDASIHYFNSDETSQVEIAAKAIEIVEQFRRRQDL